jgi:ABC-type branched-subunit amino acid transport system permease subunit
VIGAAIILLLEYYVSKQIPERWPLVLGAVFIITALLFRDGLVSAIAKGFGSARERVPPFARWRNPASQER